VLTVKGVDDPTAFVELDAAFKATMAQGGSAARLVQTFTQHNTHSYLSDPTYPTLLAALLRWVDTGDKPTPESIARQCAGMEPPFGKGCLRRWPAGWLSASGRKPAASAKNKGPAGTAGPCVKALQNS
jgi:hypothetical protein